MDANKVDMTMDRRKFFFLFGGVSCHDSRATPFAEVARRTSASGVYHHGPRRRRRQPAAGQEFALSQLPDARPKRGKVFAIQQ